MFVPVGKARADIPFTSYELLTILIGTGVPYKEGDEVVLSVIFELRHTNYQL